MVKCSECGFLASRNLQTRQLEETEPEIRSEGALSIAWNTEKPFNTYEPPICFMQVSDFKAIPYSLQFVLQRDEEKKKVLSEIQRERECKSFTTWIPGSTPKEHQEMIDREARLRWQTEREEADKKWRSKQEWRLVIMGGIIAGVFTLLGTGIGVFLTIFLK